MLYVPLASVRNRPLAPVPRLDMMQQLQQKKFPGLRLLYVFVLPHVSTWLAWTTTVVEPAKVM